MYDKLSNTIVHVHEYVFVRPDYDGPGEVVTDERAIARLRDSYSISGCLPTTRHRRSRRWRELWRSGRVRRFRTLLDKCRPTHTRTILIRREVTR